MTRAIPISAGTMSLNAPAGSTSSRIAPTSPPHTDADPSRITRRRCPTSSARYPCTPEATPGTSPTLLDTFASTGGYPSASSVGKVISVPEPTTVLMVPAARPTAKMTRACRRSWDTALTLSQPAAVASTAGCENRLSAKQLPRNKCYRGQLR